MKSPFLGFASLAVAALVAVGCESDTNPISIDSDGLTPATHESGTVVVWPGDMHGWVFAQETPIGSGQMVNGPGDPPAGTGSANLVVSNVTGGAILAYPHYQGVALASIDDLEYSTYRTSGSDPLAIALQFQIDKDLTDANVAFQGRLVYEPYHTHTVETGEWQTWDPQDDAAAGNWWFTPSSGATVCLQANPCTWTEVLTAYSNVGIHANPALGAVILKAGSGWASGFDGNTDALTISVNGVSTTYDFELEQPSPSTKDQCKKGGYATYGFKNQGQCVRFVETGKDSR